jgi:Extensin-like protein C-terminus
MSRGVRWSLVCVVLFVVLLALAGCGHFLFAERESWRHDAEVSCLNSGAVKETPQRVRISSIDGPGVCGMDFPIRVSALGDNTPLGYEDEPIRPPSDIPQGAIAGLPRSWPGAPSSAPPSDPTQSSTIQSRALPPAQGNAQGNAQGSSEGYLQRSVPQSYPYATTPSYPPPRPYPPPATTGAVGAPLSLSPPGLPPSEEAEDGIPGGPPHPYYGGPQSRYDVPPYGSAPQNTTPSYSPNSPPPLGPARASGPTAAGGPVEVSPPATLACAIVSALDQWIATAVQPAALRWFHQPVAGIKQISAYSCRGMNGDPNAHISEHAFGNALDIAEFDLADGHAVSVQYGWHGTPEEQGFLHDVQAAACDQFTTVLAPGANVYHYNHIHVDLMRRESGRRICEPAAVPGDVAAARARSRFAAQHDQARYRSPEITGSITVRLPKRDAAEDDDRMPSAVPGND